MNIQVAKVSLLAALVVGLVGLSGCKGTVEKNAAGETTSVGVKTDPAAAEAARKAGKDVTEAAKEAGQDVKEGAEKAGEAVSEGAAKAGDAVAEGAGKAAQATDDAAVTAKVKAMLLADPEVGGLKIEVDTVKGKVTLTGSAESKYQKREAGKLAMHTKGVKDVSNLIVVVPKT